MKRVAISQSNYIPWRGYFDLMDDVDLFIFYDDIQYTKHDWRNRNKIKTANGLIWLTIPVLFSLNSNTLIQDAEIDYKRKWEKKHIDSIRYSYRKAPYFGVYSEELFDFLNKKCKTISELNVSLIKWVMQKLYIKTESRMSKEFNPEGSKTDRLIDILKKVGATSYLSGPSAKSYIEVDKFKNTGIGLEYKVYNYSEYPQLYGKFEPSVTVLDLLFNCGDESRKYLKSLKTNDQVL